MKYKKGDKVRLRSMDNLYEYGGHGRKGDFPLKDEAFSEGYELTIHDVYLEKLGLWSCNWTDKNGKRHTQWIFHEKDFANKKPTIVIRSKHATT